MEKKMKNLIVLLATLCVAAVLTAALVKSGRATEIPSVTEDEEFSILVCSGDEAKAALKNIIGAYSTGGDEAAFAAASKAIRSGTCEYSTAGHRFFNNNQAPENLKSFEEVNECVSVQSGHCIAIQPIFTNDETGEIDWTGYMLILPEIADPEQWPSETEAMRLQKGLIHNSNF